MKLQRPAWFVGGLAVLVMVGITFGAAPQLEAQGYIVPNGVYQAGAPPFAVDVICNPTDVWYTGFMFYPRGTTPPSTVPNVFQYDFIANIGVRVFFVSPNDSLSLQPILAGTYTELTAPTQYEFDEGSPFYVGLYTGNVTTPPPNGIYNDPLFGWAELVNNGGKIQLLDGAIEYRGGGIIVGTDTILDVPEPSTFGLLGVGALLLGRGVVRRQRYQPN
jgi:hypothetical protein